ncbi:V-set domain-containing T-cell activation inhibitor 1-like isoform X2 [Megalobrama amblycephala]|uniref:V-set domain-containing T-cell activation inhibitor 1-like isoform X2 n=1 Tax=Megalobrama amblycephala TaxID=75352 RepID=UPI002014657E|nr:V-set domain-containing T-cell activation inhibitor 1-like isoform X2 [Megalobrama amblycephala]
MRTSFCICVFAVLINKVCLQATVKGNIGGFAVLPCSSIDNDLKYEDITVYWRHNSSQNVYDIIEGKGSMEKQDPAYKNRAETFPEEYMKGNFSLKLNKLQYSDTGKYICYITKTHQNPSTQLFIEGGKGNQGVESKAERIVPFLILLYILHFI